MAGNPSYPSCHCIAADCGRTDDANPPTLHWQGEAFCALSATPTPCSTFHAEISSSRCWSPSVVSHHRSIGLFPVSPVKAAHCQPLPSPNFQFSTPCSNPRVRLDHHQRNAIILFIPRARAASIPRLLSRHWHPQHAASREGPWRAMSAELSRPAGARPRPRPHHGFPVSQSHHIRPSRLPRCRPPAQNGPPARIIVTIFGQLVGVALL